MATKKPKNEIVAPIPQGDERPVWRRHAALALAVQAYHEMDKGSDAVSTILETAKEFDTFLKGEIKW